MIIYQTATKGNEKHIFGYILCSPVALTCGFTHITDNTSQNEGTSFLH